MEEAYGNLNAAYLQIKGMVVIEGFYALVAGFVITTFVFKLVGIIKEMINEGKGFNAKHFYELGREYIFCIGLICIMPVLLGTLETVLAYGADELMKSLANGGVYNPHNIWKDPISAMLDELMNGDITDIAVNGLDTLKWSLISGTVGSLFGVAYDYIMLLFLCTRYLILLLLEIISPIAIACLYNKDTRSSFYRLKHEAHREDHWERSKPTTTSLPSSTCRFPLLFDSGESDTVCVLSMRETITCT